MTGGSTSSLVLAGAVRCAVRGKHTPACTVFLHPRYEGIALKSALPLPASPRRKLPLAAPEAFNVQTEAAGPSVAGQRFVMSVNGSVRTENSSLDKRVHDLVTKEAARADKLQHRLDEERAVSAALRQQLKSSTGTQQTCRAARALMGRRGDCYRDTLEIRSRCDSPSHLARPGCRAAAPRVPRRHPGCRGAAPGVPGRGTRGAGAAAPGVRAPRHPGRAGAAPGAATRGAGPAPGAGTRGAGPAPELPAPY